MFGRRRGGTVRSLTNIYSLVLPHLMLYFQELQYSRACEASVCIVFLTLANLRVERDTRCFHINSNRWGLTFLYAGIGHERHLLSNKNI